MTMTKKETELSEALITTLLFPLNCLWGAFVLTYMWLWFVVPFGVQPIGKAHVMGISLFINAMAGRYTPKREGENWKPLTMLYDGAMRAGLTLLIGYICHRFMVG